MVLFYLHISALSLMSDNIYGYFYYYSQRCKISDPHKIATVWNLAGSCVRDVNIVRYQITVLG